MTCNKQRSLALGPNGIALKPWKRSGAPFLSAALQFNPYPDPYDDADDRTLTTTSTLNGIWSRTDPYDDVDDVDGATLLSALDVVEINKFSKWKEQRRQESS